MAVIVILWLILIFVGIRYVNVSDDIIAFDKDSSLALRGICSIEIMLGHIGIAVDSAVLFPNCKAGILFVGVFFALSGYGLMYSMQHKENYLKKFLWNRFPQILLPAYIIYVAGGQLIQLTELLM